LSSQEKISPEAVADMVSQQPSIMTSSQAGNLARTLVAQARQRWHGDIDDITAVAPAEHVQNREPLKETNSMNIDK
jgi:hypothetical protein